MTDWLETTTTTQTVHASEFYNKRRSHNTIHATGKARATASSEAVVLTVAVVGPPIRGIVESASTVVLAEKTIPIGRAPLLQVLAPKQPSQAMKDEARDIGHA